MNPRRSSSSFDTCSSQRATLRRCTPNTSKNALQNDKHLCGRIGGLAEARQRKDHAGIEKKLLGRLLELLLVDGLMYARPDPARAFLLCLRTFGIFEHRLRDALPRLIVVVELLCRLFEGLHYRVATTT